MSDNWIKKIKLTEEEKQQIYKFDFAEDPYSDFGSFTKKTRCLFKMLPNRVVEEAITLRNGESNVSALVIKNVPVDKSQNLCDLDWYDTSLEKSSFISESLLFTVGNLMGQVYFYSDETTPRLFRNIVPNLKNKAQPELDWHTDFAWANFRPDFLLFFCNRNECNVPTEVSLSEDILNVMTDSEKRSVYNHKTSLQQPETVKLQASSMDVEHEDITLIDKYALTIRMKYRKSFYSANLENIIRACEKCKKNITLEQGDILILDNRRVLHKRPSYSTNTLNRWIQQLFVSCDPVPKRKYRTGVYGFTTN